MVKNMEPSNERKIWFGECRRWLTNKDSTVQKWERPPPEPIEYWDVSTDPNYVEVEAEPLQETDHVPVYPIHTVRLSRTDVGINNDDDPNPILPGFWWILGYMALTALTAVGIRQSIK